jgi:hypothetical protein
MSSTSRYFPISRRTSVGTRSSVSALELGSMIAARIRMDDKIFIVYKIRRPSIKALNTGISKFHVVAASPGASRLRDEISTSGQADEDHGNLVPQAILEPDSFS